MVPGTSAAERSLTRLLYHSLVRADCDGSLQPEMARRWRMQDDRVSWAVDLIPDAVFRDGADIDAAAVGAALQRRSLRGLAGIEPRGDLSVLIRTMAPDSLLPVRLASDSAVLSGPARVGAPPVETGPYRWVGRIGLGDTESINLAAVEPGVPDFLRIVIDPATDPRDQLDRALRPGAGVLMITRDAEALAYAGRLPGVVVRALAWDRTYGLVRGPTAADTTPSLPERSSLATEVVGGDSRPAGPDAICRASGAGSAARRRALVGYDQSDPVARRLAERIVSLAGAAPAPGWIGAPPGALRAAPLRTSALDSALAAGTLWGAVVGWPGPGCGTAAVPPGDVGLPLIESRSWLIRGGSVPAVAIRSDGSFRFPVAR